VKKILLSGFACLALAGCQSLPMAGPSADSIKASSSSKFTKNSSNKPRLSYEVIDVDRNILAILSERRLNTFEGSFGGKGSANGGVVGRGDQIVVTIWEASSGGLFAGANGASSSALPAQPVDSEGRITVPFAGRIKAAGRTPYQIKSSIEQALEGKAIEPQVLVSVTKPVFSTVTVSGEASSGGRVPLTGRGDRLLDVIAAVGGPSTSVKEVAIQLTRGNMTRRVAMDRVVQTPSENVFMRPGDIVTLLRDERTVSVFGAAKTNLEVKLEPGQTVLSETLARAGGLHDSLASPESVFIYRVEDAHTVSHFLPNSKLAAENTMVPVIYRVNLKDPSGFFIARAFKMMDKDILYAANAPSVQFGKFTTLLNNTLSPISGAATTSLAVRAATN